MCRLCPYTVDILLGLVVDVWVLRCPVIIATVIPVCTFLESSWLVYCDDCVFPSWLNEMPSLCFIPPRYLCMIQVVFPQEVWMLVSAAREFEAVVESSLLEQAADVWLIRCIGSRSCWWHLPPFLEYSTTLHLRGSFTYLPTRYVGMSLLGQEMWRV